MEATKLLDDAPLWKTSQMHAWLNLYLRHVDIARGSADSL